VVVVGALEELPDNVEGDSILPWVATSFNRLAKAGDDAAYDAFLTQLLEGEFANPFAYAAKGVHPITGEPMDAYRGRTKIDPMPVPLGIYHWATQEGIDLNRRKDPEAVIADAALWFAPQHGTLVYEFGDGRSLYQIGAGPDAAEELTTEGLLMNHCIGNPDFQHYHQILKGSFLGFSLRDEEGRPVASFKIHPTRGRIIEARGYGNRSITPGDRAQWDTFATSADSPFGPDDGSWDFFERTVDGGLTNEEVFPGVRDLEWSFRGADGDAIGIALVEEGVTEHPNIRYNGPATLEDVPDGNVSITVREDATWDDDEDTFIIEHIQNLIDGEWIQYLEDDWQIQEKWAEQDWDDFGRDNAIRALARRVRERTAGAIQEGDADEVMSELDHNIIDRELFAVGGENWEIVSSGDYNGGVEWERYKDLAEDVDFFYAFFLKHYAEKDEPLPVPLDELPWLVSQIGSGDAMWEPGVMTCLTSPDQIEIWEDDPDEHVCGYVLYGDLQRGSAWNRASDLGDVNAVIDPQTGHVEFTNPGVSSPRQLEEALAARPGVRRVAIGSESPFVDRALDQAAVRIAAQLEAEAEDDE